VIAHTTPIGYRIVNPIRSFTPGAPSSGTISPVSRVASSADSRSVCTARSISPATSLSVKPLSATMMAVSSSRRASSSSAARDRIW
jgi:hypothetical protein